MHALRNLHKQNRSQTEYDYSSAKKPLQRAYIMFFFSFDLSLRVYINEITKRSANIFGKKGGGRRERQRNIIQCRMYSDFNPKNHIQTQKCLTWMQIETLAKTHTHTRAIETSRPQKSFGAQREMWDTHTQHRRRQSATRTWANRKIYLNEKKNYAWREEEAQQQRQWRRHQTNKVVLNMHNNTTGPKIEKETTKQPNSNTTQKIRNSTSKLCYSI